jgi:hypothetical protein
MERRLKPILAAETSGASTRHGTPPFEESEGRGPETHGQSPKTDRGIYADIA